MIDYGNNHNVTLNTYFNKNKQPHFIIFLKKKQKTEKKGISSENVCKIHQLFGYIVFFTMFNFFYHLNICITLYQIIKLNLMFISKS